MITVREQCPSVLGRLLLWPVDISWQCRPKRAPCENIKKTIRSSNMPEDILRELQGRGEPCSLPRHATAAWVLDKRRTSLWCAPPSSSWRVQSWRMPLIHSRPRLVNVVDLISDGCFQDRPYSRNVSVVPLHFTLTSGTFGRRDIFLVRHVVPHPSQMHWRVGAAPYRVGNSRAPLSFDTPSVAREYRERRISDITMGGC